MKRPIFYLLTFMAFLVVSKYVEMDAFSFSMGAIYVITLDLIDIFFKN